MTLLESELGTSALLEVADIWWQVPDVTMLISSACPRLGEHKDAALPATRARRGAPPRISPAVARPKADDFQPQAGWLAGHGWTGLRDGCGHYF